MNLTKKKVNESKAYVHKKHLIAIKDPIGSREMFLLYVFKSPELVHLKTFNST